MAIIQDTFRVNGLPVNGVTWTVFPASSVSAPAKGTAKPGSGSVATGTTGTTHGADGAYRATGLQPGDYYICFEYGSDVIWDHEFAESYGVVIPLMAGFTPSATGGDAAEFVVPYSPVDGTTSFTWTVRRINFRVAGAGGAPAAKVEKYTGSGAFSATEVGTVTLASGASEGEIHSGFTTSTLTSGDKLRVNAVTLATATGWSVDIVLEKAT